MARPFCRWRSVCRQTAEWPSPQSAVTAFVDTSVLIDYLRGHRPTAVVLEDLRAVGPLHASEITRLEVLAGMRAGEERATRSLLWTLIWHPVDSQVAVEAGALGRRWIPSHHTIDSADLAIAATVQLTGLPLLTKNVWHSPCSRG